MHTLETNNLVVFNNLTCQIHAEENFDKMCHAFLQQVQMLVDFDAAVFYYSDCDKLPELTHAVCYEYDENTAREYMDRWQQEDYSRGLLMGGKKMVYRDSDVISDIDRAVSLHYKRLFRDKGYASSVNILPASKGKVLAKISFYRKDGKPDFVYDDIFLLDMLQEHLSLRIQRNYDEIAHRHNKLSIEECSEKFGLTARENKILGLLMQGLNNDTICTQLNITNNTLKKHILNIYKKLNIRNRTQLFKLVREYAD